MKPKQKIFTSFRINFLSNDQLFINNNNNANETQKLKIHVIITGKPQQTHTLCVRFLPDRNPKIICIFCDLQV